MPPRELIQCAANVSEGRRRELIDELAALIAAVPGIRLCDVHSDIDHNRSVYTWLGAADACREALLAVARIALQKIDLRLHQGVHPRLGALDVVPFVPFGSTSLEACAELARQVAAELAAAFDLPVYLYEHACPDGSCRPLPQLRGRGFEAYAGIPLTGDRRPDYGPGQLHPTAGAAIVGAREPLLAYNIDLAGADIETARAIAAQVREKGGGLPGVRALGLYLPLQNRIQISMNLTRPRVTSMAAVTAEVARLAAAHGASVSGCELVGALRIEDLAASLREATGSLEISSAQVLDLQAAELRA